MKQLFVDLIDWKGGLRTVTLCDNDVCRYDVTCELIVYKIRVIIDNSHGCKNNESLKNATYSLGGQQVYENKTVCDNLVKNTLQPSKPEAES